MKKKTWTRSGNLVYKIYGGRRNRKCMRCGWRKRKRGALCNPCWKKAGAAWEDPQARRLP
jgi:hypothetical protein